MSSNQNTGVEAQCEAARRCLDRGRIDRAESMARDAVASAPAHVGARLLLADCLSQQGEAEALREAEELSRGVIEVEPEALEAHLVLADVTYQLDRPEQARAAARQAIEIDPRCSHALALLAWIELDRQNWAQAFQCAEQALEFQPKQVNALEARRIAAEQLGQADQAPGSTASSGDDQTGPDLQAGLRAFEEGRGYAGEMLRKSLGQNPLRLDLRVGLLRVLLPVFPIRSRVALTLARLAMVGWPIRLAMLLLAYGIWRLGLSGTSPDSEGMLTLVVAAGLTAAVVASLGGPLSADSLLVTMRRARVILPGPVRTIARIGGVLMGFAIAAAVTGVVLSDELWVLVALMIHGVTIPLSALPCARPEHRGVAMAYVGVAFALAVATGVGSLLEWEQVPLLATAGALAIALAGWAGHAIRSPKSRG